MLAGLRGNLGRRAFLLLSLALPAACTAVAAALAAELPRRHALSLVGPPKFGPDFQHFDWVDPEAP
jgi:microcin C transport system substrate-binding protein